VRAIDSSSPLRIGVSDWLGLTLSEREGCEFLTAAHKLVKNLQAQFPFVVPLASMPGWRQGESIPDAICFSLRVRHFLSQAVTTSRVRFQSGTRSGVTPRR
jgi:hypothetical protein